VPKRGEAICGIEWVAGELARCDGVLAGLVQAGVDEERPESL
jgi:hypothetical protein